MNKLNLRNYVAERMLHEIYAPKKYEKECEELPETCADYTAIEKILKEYAREFKEEMNRRAVLIVLDSLSREKKRLIKLKYGEQKQLVSVSLTLNVSIAQLMVWNQNIIEKITECMMYRLTREDIYCKKKIEGMLEMMTLTINFFSELSVEYKQVRQEWLEELKRKKNNYQNLLNRLEKFERKKSEDNYAKAILAKIRNPNGTNKEIAIACHLHKATVSRFLKKFEEKMSGYLK